VAVGVTGVAQLALAAIVDASNWMCNLALNLDTCLPIEQSH
jgi:hypothetical protein